MVSVQLRHSHERPACTCMHASAHSSVSTGSGRHPPSQLRRFVQESSHDHGVVSTTHPPLLTMLGNRYKKAPGSGRRHSRFAARTASTGARLEGSAHASPARKRTRLASVPAGSCAMRCSCTRPRVLGGVRTPGTRALQCSLRSTCGRGSLSAL